MASCNAKHIALKMSLPRGLHLEIGMHVGSEGTLRVEVATAKSCICYSPVREAHIQYTTPCGRTCHHPSIGSLYADHTILEHHVFFSFIRMCSHPRRCEHAAAKAHQT